MGRPPGSKNKNGSTWLSVEADIPLGDPNETEPQIEARINKTFRVYERLMNGVVDGKFLGFIVSGAAGCGKTHLMESVLAERMAPNDYHVHSGTMSGVELYKSLYKLRGHGQIFAADDCDSIYHSETELNTLKQATDPKRSGRNLLWGKNSWTLLASKNDGEEIPREFPYFGSCVFGTNLDFQALIHQNTKLSRHYSALLDRMPYLDLGIHTKRDILVRIWQVMNTTNFCEENKIERKMGNQILEWIRKNIVAIQRPSIRTAIKLGNMMKSDMATWEETAQVTLFRR